MTSPARMISGRIADRPIADLFDSVHQGGRTGVARFRTALGSATVWFRDGELVDAEMGRFHADAAVLRLLKIQDGEFELEITPVDRNRTVRVGTAQLLEEGRQRAPRPGPSSMGQAAAGQRSAARPGSAPAVLRERVHPASGLGAVTPDATRPAPGGPRPARPPRADTDAHTTVRASPLVGAAAEPAIGARPPSGEQTVIREPRVEQDPVDRPPTPRGPARRPVAASWSPTAGSDGQALPEPPAPEPPVPEPSGPPSSTGRTRFMFGVSGPAAPRPGGTLVPTGAPETPAVSPVPARPLSSASPAAVAPVAAPQAAPFGAPATPVDPLSTTLPRVREDGAPPSATDHGRRKSAQAPRAPRFGAPGSPLEEPPSIDRTLMRPGPVPPPPGKAPVRGVAEAVTPAPSPFPTPAPFPTPKPAPSEPVPVAPAATPSGPRPAVPSTFTPIVAPPVAMDSGAVSPLSASGPQPTPTHAHTARFVPGAYGPVSMDSGAVTPISGAVTPISPGAPPSAPVPPPSAPEPDPGLGWSGPMPIYDEEYSHPISIPNAPPNYGPGGTWMLGPTGRPPSGPQRPLPDDPEAEQTVVLRSDGITPLRPEAVAEAARPHPDGGTPRVGRYEVLLRLARGGMGTVYLCRITGEGGFRRLFALKVIREHLNSNQAYVDMLLDEARIASQLHHPNIVPIIDIDVFAGQHYLVMDYVEGCTFSELLKANPKARPPDLIIPVVLDALTGLHAAHTVLGPDGTIQPLVHCDFSPQNMLVGINGTCRLIDFGVAKASDTVLHGANRGKPGYLSPEQVRGLPVDPRSDVWAAGVVLWNALTGEQLFAGETPEQVMHQVVTGRVPKPSTVGLRPPACFDRICLRALERDPARRYQSAEEMLMELRKVAIAEDLVAPSSAVGQWVLDTFGAQIERRRKAAGMGGEVALARREVGPTGHADRPLRYQPEAEPDLDASQTLMLPSRPRGRAEVREEGLGARTKVVVLVSAMAFMLAAAVTLWMRPDLLQGGVLDEYGEYQDLAPIDPDDPDENPALRVAGTGTDGDDTGRDTGEATEGEPVADTETEPVADTEAAADDGETPTEDGGKPSDVGKPGDASKPKPGRAKPKGDGTKPKDDGGTKPQDDGTKPSDDGTKPKDDGRKPSDGGTKPKDDKKPKKPKPEDVEPVDLEQLFRPPGG